MCPHNDYNAFPISYTRQISRSNISCCQSLPCSGRGANVSTERMTTMADDVKVLLNLSDKDLLERLVSELNARYLSGAESSTKLAEAVLTMRATIRNAAYTKHLAISTWAIAVITLITQVALVILTLRK